MLLYFFLVCFCLFAKVVDATALTYKIEAHEHACFFVWNDTPGKKVGFYFAVIPPLFFFFFYNSSIEIYIGSTGRFV